MPKPTVIGRMEEDKGANPMPEHLFAYDFVLREHHFLAFALIHIKNDEGDFP